MISQTPRATVPFVSPFARHRPSALVRDIGLGAASMALLLGLSGCGGNFDAATVATGADSTDATDATATDVDLASVTGTPTPGAGFTLEAGATPNTGTLKIPNTTGTPSPLGLDLSGTANGSNLTDDASGSTKSSDSASTTSTTTTTTTATGSSGSTSGSSSGSSSGGSTGGSGGTTAPPANRTEAVDYTVQSGDVLGVIAERYGVSASTIAAANGITPDSIRIGQVLTIPPPGTVITAPAPTEAPATTPTPVAHVNRPAGTPTQYIVADGDRIEDVAKMHDVTVNAIAGANGLTEIVSIYSGACLIIPPSGSTTSERIEPTASLCGGGGGTTDPTPVPSPEPTPEATATPDGTPTPAPTADPNATPGTDTDYGENFYEWKPGEDPAAFRARCVADGGQVAGPLQAVCDLPG